MKNILLITSLYPSDDVKFLNNTAVCHYFAKEWVEMGYNVKVIHSYRIYPTYVYPLLKLMNKYLAKTQATAVLDKRLDSIHEYRMDGVSVVRIPIYKKRPHGEFTRIAIEQHCNDIHKILIRDNFIPDVILGHFVTPSLEIVTRLKDFYPMAKTAVSMHGKGDIRGFRMEDKLNFEKLNYMGYRSHAIRMAYESMYGSRPYLMCPSGVPEEYILTAPKDIYHSVQKFVYVGSFMDRKHPSTVVEALSKSLCNVEYTLTFVGDGDGRKKIENTARRFGNIDKIKFTGRIPREQVTAEMDKADVFIMVSENETFGLVYLEAMARGCIVVASKDEGMEGIIENGINGFLSKAGDADELAATIDYIKKLPIERLYEIAEAGRQTALRMTDKKVAKEYIDVFM